MPELAALALQPEIPGGGDLLGGVVHGLPGGYHQHLPGTVFKELIFFRQPLVFLDGLLAAPGPVDHPGGLAVLLSITGSKASSGSGTPQQLGQPNQGMGLSDTS